MWDGAEEPLPNGGSCLLGSINLAEFVKNPFTPNATFDHEEFKKIVGVAVRGLNDVLLEGLPLHPLEIQRQTVHDWRQIGLGVMGIADMLIKLGIRYGSKESIRICDTIAFNLANKAILTSSEIARDNGTYPKYNRDAVLSSEYLKYKQQEFESDKDDDGTLAGKIVSKSKQKKVVEYLNSMNIQGR